MTTLNDYVSDVRTSLEDYGNLVTDQFSGDATTIVWQLSSAPILTNSESVTIAGAAQARTTNYTVNYDNGQITFVSAPAAAAAVVIQYTKVIWRDERIINAVNAGIREMYPAVYRIGEAYVLLQTQVWDYDLSLASIVPPASSFGDQTLPVEYNATTARQDLLKAQTRIHFYEYHPYGQNQVYTPYEFCRRTTPNMLHIDGDPMPNDTMRIVYTAPCSTLANLSDVSNVPDEYYMLPIWFALSVLMEKKEARRSRYDGYTAMQGTNAVPPGTQAQTAEDYLMRYRELIQTSGMRPFPIRTRRQARSWMTYSGPQYGV